MSSPTEQAFDKWIDNGLTGLGFVIDRASLGNAKEWLPILESRPGNLRGWTTGIERFESDAAYRFLFMIAEDQDRLVRAAPMIGRLETVTDLTDATKHYVALQRGKVVWLTMLDEDKTLAKLAKILKAATPRYVCHDAT
jgi:hypothetical protein